MKSKEELGFVGTVVTSGVCFAGMIGTFASVAAGSLGVIGTGNWDAQNFIVSHDVPLLAAAGVGMLASIAAYNAASNVTSEDLKNLGSSIKGFGQSAINAASELGRSMGIVKENTSAVGTLVADLDEPNGRSYWAKVGKETYQGMVATGLITCTVGAIVTVATGLNFDAMAAYLPGAIASAGVAAAMYVPLKSIMKEWEAEDLEKVSSSLQTNTSPSSINAILSAEKAPVKNVESDFSLS